MSEFVIGVTGHRQLYHSSKQIKEKLIETLKTFPPTKIITGMALGFDQLVAEVCISLEIPFIAAVPYYQQDSLWSETQKTYYHYLLSEAKEIKIVSDGEPEIWKLFKRNQWIADNSYMIIAYKVQEDGGTASCCDYAKKQNKPVINIAEKL